MAGEKEGDRQAERIQREHQALQRQEEMMAQQARRNDAAMVADRILDPRMEDPDLAWLTVLPWMEVSVDTVTTITDYESKPIQTALLLKAVGGGIDSKRMEYVRGYEKQLAVIEADSNWQNAVVKVQRYKEGFDVEMQAMTADEQKIWSEYEKAKGQRDVVLEMMTNGMYGALQRVDFLENRIRALQVRRDVLSLRAGDLSADERSEFDNLYGTALEEMKTGEVRELARLRADASKRKLSIEEEEMLERLLKQAEEILEKNKKDSGSHFRDLYNRSGNMSEEERGIYEQIANYINGNNVQLVMAKEQVEEKAKQLGIKPKWMAVYRAFSGMVSNVNTTDQWRRAWHDVGEGSQGIFTQTRWTEFQKTSELLAMCEVDKIGPAFKEAFRVLVQVGLNDTIDDGGANWNVGGADNIYQQEKLTNEDMERFYRRVAKTVGSRLGMKEDDYFVQHAVQQARMLFENSGCSAWFMVKRERAGERAGEIMYIDERGNESSDFNSNAYKYGVVARGGDGTGYADRQNDYVKIWATRSKYFGEFVQGNPSGLPALMPVLPDYLSRAWFSHEELVAIADGVKMIETKNKSTGKLEFVPVPWDLATLLGGVKYSKPGCEDIKIRGLPENSRWGFTYALFRAGGLLDRFISQLPVAGLKGYRSAAEEVEYFLHNPAVLNDLNKRVIACTGLSETERLRFKANIFMALRYSVYVDLANPDSSSEQKSIVPNRELGKALPIVAWEKDDFERIFVKTGFLSQDAFDFVWTRFKTIYEGKGGKPSVGMIKRSEAEELSRFVGPKRSEELSQRRREQLVNQV